MRRFFYRALRKFVTLFIPVHKRHAWRYWLHLNLDAAPELRHLSKLLPVRNENGVALDIGANEGWFAQNLMSVGYTVLAFEINPILAGNLAALRNPRLIVHAFGLSNRFGTAQLFIPIRANRVLHGWGSFSQTHCAVAEDFITVHVAHAPLDSLAKKVVVSFIKIDVEGHECEVLEGARETISRNRPRVLVEVAQENRPAVRSFFKDLNYAEKTLFELCGESGEDLIFFPN